MTKFTEKEAQELIDNVQRGKMSRQGITVPPAPAVREVQPKMNGTETRYANMLELEKKAGLIKEYRFGSVTLLLVDPKKGIKGIRYTPDFEVIRLDGNIELVEIKGAGPIREDSWLKFKMAIDKFPEFKFTLARWIKGQWMFLWKDK